MACNAISKGCIVKYDDVEWFFEGESKGKAFPIFSGGTLSFEGYENQFWYGEDGGGFDIRLGETVGSIFFPIFELYDNKIDNFGTHPKFYGKLRGDGNMNFTGSGDTRLYGENLFTGLTRITVGRLVIEDKIAKPTGKIQIDDNATLKLKGDNIQITTRVTSNNGRINFAGKNVKIESEIVSERGENNGALKLFVHESLIDQEGKVSIKPRITGSISGSGGILKTGEGSLALSGSNTFTGPTRILKGELSVEDSGSLAGTPTITIEKGAKLKVKDQAKLNDKASVIIAEGSDYFADSDDTIGLISGAGRIKLFNASKTLSVGASDENSIDSGFSGVISGQGSFTKTGNATLVLSGANTFTGDTSIDSGTLEVRGSLSHETDVIVGDAIYDVKSTDTIGSIAGTGFIFLDDDITLKVGANNSSTTFSGIIQGYPSSQGTGGFAKTGSGTLTLSGNNYYLGATSINQGVLQVTGTLSDSTAVIVSSGATYDVKSIDTIGSIAGAGSVVLADDITLTAGANNNPTTFTGKISGKGNFTKDGSGTLSISGKNALQLQGKTTAKSGTIDFGTTSQEIANLSVDKNANISNGKLTLAKLNNSGAIKVDSLSGTDAANDFTNDGTIEITTSANIDLKAGDDIFTTNSNLTLSGVLDGGAGDDLIKFGSSDNKLHPFRAAKIINFESAEQTSGTWDYDGNFKDSGIETMTLKGGVMEILDSEHATFENFVMEGGQIVASLESKNSAPLTADSFDYQGGSLLIKSADQADPEGTYTVIDAPAASQGEMNELAAKSVLEYDNMAPERFTGIGIKNGIKGSAIYDVFLKEGSLQLVVEQKHHADILDCLKDDSCDKPVAPGDDPHHHEIKPGRPGHDILKVILDDILKELDLPIIGYGTLSRLTISGLAPRNIDGPSRGMATYNNLLADTLFERLPLRQFDPVVIEETVVEEEEVIEEDPAPPVRGLWSKSGELSDQDAQQALDRAIAQNTDVVVEESTTVERLEAAGFVEDPSLTAQYARRDGVRAWFRAFGGDDRDSSNDNFHNPYYVNSGGGVLGVDVSVSESFQVGAFVNYGNINLIQQGALAGGGSWNSDGWGGGVRADYWTDNFYVQGLFSATGFSGNQKRDIVEITSQLGDDTASGSKSATSYGLAFRVGAPFEAGDLLIEPQFTSTWSFNNENRFTESGSGDLNLTYKDRSTTYLQTDLAIKFAYPIKTGDTSELVPSLRVGWLGDWSGNLSNQKIGYRFTDDTVNIDSINEDTNGVLVEGGLDYTIANINSSSYKVYVRGGIEAWGGTRGTDYRASGGFEWQF